MEVRVPFGGHDPDTRDQRGLSRPDDSLPIRRETQGRPVSPADEIRVVNEDGSMLLNLGGSVLSHGGETETDFHWYDKGCTVITPLSIDATDYKKLKHHESG